nr:hypothetical protein [Kibdelosporangium sp. MJ126-NF4]CTQ98174.1 hypothetical protein [Kibdelosporangium sp. MJ126-NF4]
MSDLTYTLMLIGLFLVLTLALRWLNHHAGLNHHGGSGRRPMTEPHQPPSADVVRPVRSGPSGMR